MGEDALASYSRMEGLSSPILPALANPVTWRAQLGRNNRPLTREHYFKIFFILS